MTPVTRFLPSTVTRFPWARDRRTPPALPTWR